MVWASQQFWAQWTRFEPQGQSLVVRYERCSLPGVTGLTRFEGVGPGTLYGDSGPRVCGGARLGAGTITALPVAGHEELRTGLVPLDEQLNAIQKFRLADGFLMFTDAYTFTLAGAPGLAFYQDSPNYALVGHSAADRLDKVDAEILARNTATVVAAALWIADSGEQVGKIWSGEEIKTRLAELKQREMLESLGMWPSVK
jgi:hypothetical protein